MSLTAIAIANGGYFEGTQRASALELSLGLAGRHPYVFVLNGTEVGTVTRTITFI